MKCLVTIAYAMFIYALLNKCLYSVSVYDVYHKYNRQIARAITCHKRSVVEEHLLSVQNAPELNPKLAHFIEIRHLLH